MIIPINPSSDSNGSASEMEKVTAAATLMAIGHALCDYVTSSDELFMGLCAMLGHTEESDVAEIRDSLQQAHDTFLSMTMRATQDLMASVILGALAGDGEDGDGDIDISGIIGL